MQLIKNSDTNIQFKSFTNKMMEIILNFTHLFLHLALQSHFTTTWPDSVVNVEERNQVCFSKKYSSTGQ
jgi:hypothetical protein